jgi:hypothetical protein
MSNTPDIHPVDTPETTAAKTHFDLHVNGIGYLNRIREVKIKKGSFWACTIAALHGSIDEPETTYFDCKIEGAEALNRVRFLKSAVDAQCKVTVSFRVSDIYPEAFVYQSGSKQGETGITIKGRLLKIGAAKIDGLPVDFAEMRFAA